MGSPRDCGLSPGGRFIGKVTPRIFSSTFLLHAPCLPVTCGDRTTHKGQTVDTTGKETTSKDKNGNLVRVYPLSSGRWSLWGDVRIASAPQQITTGVGTFASTIATQVSTIPVNQLAQSADFQTGVRIPVCILLSCAIPAAATCWKATRKTLGLIGCILAAMGSFQPPSSQIQIFDVPANTAPQYTLFAQQFPTAANAKYIGFVPPDRERFYRNFGVGFRFTTFDRDQPLAPPATYTFSVGQDESITGGIFRSVVGRLEVFYPLPTGNTTTGAFTSSSICSARRTCASAKAVNIPTFALQDPNAQPRYGSKPGTTL